MIVCSKCLKKICECKNPPEFWRHVEVPDDQAQKPDATPREFWIKACVALDTPEGAKKHYAGEKRYDMENAPVFHVIEKSAYDALAKELQQVRHDFKLALEQQPFKDNRKELAAAKAEIERLKKSDKGGA